MSLKTKLITAPTVEPITLAELELHLRITSNDIASDLASTQSIAPGSHAVAAAYSLEGTGVDVLNSQSVVYLVSGTNGTGAKVDVKVQESDDNVTYTDWTGGGFTQVTTANDNATYEKAYTGTKQYIRVVSTVAVDACSFGVDIITSSPLSVEDDYLTSLIVSARRIIELHAGRRFITQTWDIALDGFPSGKIVLPGAPLQSVSTVKYYDTDDTEATFSSGYYYVDTYSEPGAVSLNYGDSWPSTTLRPTNGVIIQYVSGYGDAGSDVPDMYKQAVKMLCSELYEHREDGITGTKFSELPWAVKQLIGYERIVRV